MTVVRIRLAVLGMNLQCEKTGLNDRRRSLVMIFEGAAMGRHGGRNSQSPIGGFPGQWRARCASARWPPLLLYSLNTAQSFILGATTLGAAHMIPGLCSAIPARRNVPDNASPVGAGPRHIRDGPLPAAFPCHRGMNGQWPVGLCPGTGSSSATCHVGMTAGGSLGDELVVCP